MCEILTQGPVLGNNTECSSERRQIPAKFSLESAQSGHAQGFPGEAAQDKGQATERTGWNRWKKGLIPVLGQPLTFETSHLARLNCVHYNPVRHGVVDLAENCRWCSANWFIRNTSPSFVATVKSYKTANLDIPDDF